MISFKWRHCKQDIELMLVRWVEQDHRFIKKIFKPMKRFKAFHPAEATLAGIELHHMLRKEQHNQSIFKQFYGLPA